MRVYVERPESDHPGRFIDEATSVTFDMLRGLAAMAVLVAHSVQLGLYGGPWWFTSALQHDVVQIFFVLSGIAICDSVRKPNMDLRHYVAKRTGRILPPALAAVMFSTIAWFVCRSLGDVANGAYPYDRVSIVSVVEPLLFLSERMDGVGPALDPSYWSLCYEVTYYALFGAFFFLRGPRRWLSLLLIVALAGPKPFLLLPGWAMGALLASSPRARNIGPAAGFVLILCAATGLALFLHFDLPALAQRAMRAGGQEPTTLRFSDYWPSDAVLAFLITLAFAGLRPVAGMLSRALGTIAPPARFYASFSFSLYLFHWPIIRLMHAAGIPPAVTVGGWCLRLAVPISCAILLSRVLERQTLRTWVGRAVAKSHVAHGLARLMQRPGRPTPV